MQMYGANSSPPCLPAQVVSKLCAIARNKRCCHQRSAPAECFDERRSAPLDEAQGRPCRRPTVHGPTSSPELEYSIALFES